MIINVGAHVGTPLHIVPNCIAGTRIDAPINAMKYDPHRHHRRSLRLQGYDYAQSGTYFITICTHNRPHLFGTVHDGSLCLNKAGKMLEDWWLRLPTKFPSLSLDAFVIMPNHLHGILVLQANPVAQTASHSAPNLGRVLQ
jgi:hypothetical protein